MLKDIIKTFSFLFLLPLSLLLVTTGYGFFAVTMYELIENEFIRIAIGGAMFIGGFYVAELFNKISGKYKK